jgi:uncharacterized protein (TIGR02594 family)
MTTELKATKPIWIEEAFKHIGKKEIPGQKSNKWIVSLWESLKGLWLFNTKADDSLVPWCGTFAAHCIKSAGYPLPKHWYRAKAWLNWGVDVGWPCYGCIVVFERKGGGHVGFVVGKDKTGRLMVLGGNQGDAVNVMPFDTARAVGYRMPVGVLSRITLPLMASTDLSSTNEA